jgi:hypothetical protein
MDGQQILVFVSTMFQILNLRSNQGMKPICYAAMEKRSIKAYTILFNALKEAATKIGFDLTPTDHMIDFEIAAARASKIVFPKTSISFCHFHFAQAIWRNIQKKSMRYKSFCSLCTC